MPAHEPLRSHMSPESPSRLTSQRSIVDQVVAMTRTSALFSDFDGTISEVVTDPDTAMPVPGAAEALCQLSRHLGKVALVSGRPAEWLANRVTPGPFDRLEIYGLHGLEQWTPTGVVAARAAQPYLQVMSTVVERSLEAGIEGMVVEDKSLSVTLHWRAAFDIPGTPERAAGLARALAVELGLELRPGKASAELVPPIGIDKGSVVAQAGDGFELVVFLGDDIGDIAGFEALDRLAGKGALTARVAVGGREAPQGLLSRADVVLSGPLEAARFLAEIAAAIASR
jgi:trehalose 6-phosphate phosphatase